MIYTLVYLIFWLILFLDYAGRYLSLGVSVTLTLELLLPRLYNRAPGRTGAERERPWLISRVRPRTRWPTMNGYVSGAGELVTRYLPPRFTPCSLASGIIIPENRLFPHRLSPRRRSSRLRYSSFARRSEHCTMFFVVFFYIQVVLVWHFTSDFSCALIIVSGVVGRDKFTEVYAYFFLSNRFLESIHEPFSSQRLV